MAALWRQRETRYIVRVLVAVGVLVAVVVGSYLIYSTADESGWIPHTQVVTVRIGPSEWIGGEHKVCSSSADLPLSPTGPQEITALDCGGVASEAQNFSVRFWGPNDTQMDRTWNCERGLSQVDGLTALTCKLH